MSEGRRVHVVGAGLAGLSAAVELAHAGRRVVLHEASPQAGGRCRSYLDPALGLVIDNGNHLILSGNEAALGYVRRIGGEGALRVLPECAIPFLDLATGERWTLRPDAGPVPTWIFRESRRVPRTRPGDYLAPLGLLFAREGDRLGERMRTEGPAWERLWRPFLVSALNMEPADASARLAARLVRETFGRGGAACRPVIAEGGLGAALVEPALGWLRGRGAEIRFGASLRAVEAREGQATALRFPGAEERLGAGDAMVLALPPGATATLLPGLDVPTRFSPILNLHFRAESPASVAPLTGLVGGISEWLFRFPDRLSVTVSAAERWNDRPREEMARLVWAEVARAAGLPAEPLPPWQVVREKRATYLPTPEEELRRPPAATRLANLFLAGDWTRTGLPATIEGAVRSGRTAAALALRMPDTQRRAVA